MYGCSDPALVYGVREPNEDGCLSRDFLLEFGEIDTSYQVVENYTAKGIIYGVGCDMDELKANKCNEEREEILTNFLAVLKEHGYDFGEPSFYMTVKSYDCGLEYTEYTPGKNRTKQVFQVGEHPIQKVAQSQQLGGRMDPQRYECVLVYGIRDGISNKVLDDEILIKYDMNLYAEDLIRHFVSNYIYGVPCTVEEFREGKCKGQESVDNFYEALKKVEYECDDPVFMVVIQSMEYLPYKDKYNPETKEVKKVKRMTREEEMMMIMGLSGNSPFGGLGGNPFRFGSGF